MTQMNSSKPPAAPLSMSSADDNALLEVVARELNGGPLKAPSLKAFYARQRAAALIDAIEDAGFVIARVERSGEAHGSHPV